MEIIKKFEPLFGEWYAESFIGAGSFGRVYKIYREELGNRFYSALKYISIPADTSEIKQLRADGMDDASISTYYGTLARDISSETTLMNQLRGNTNIVSFEDSRIVPKPNGIGYDIFIRMELLDSLTNRMVEKPLSPNEVVKLGSDICNALILCAKTGIIHRDIKPDNIFVSPNGDYKLGDFGIARQLEKTATFMSKKGTYNYMAPEVYKGEKYGATCDLYSLGLVMYRLLNKGRLPFLPAAPAPITANDRERSLQLRFQGKAILAPCDADEELSNIIMKACAFNVKDRFATAEDMKDALTRYINGEHDIIPVVPVADFDRTHDDTDETQGVFGKSNGSEADDVIDPNSTSGVFSNFIKSAGKTGAEDNSDKTHGAFAGAAIPVVVESAPKFSVAETPKNVAQQPKNSKNKKPMKKRSGWIIGIAAALALAFGLMAVLGVFSKKQPIDVIDANSATPVPISSDETTAPATQSTITDVPATAVPTEAITPVTATPTPEPLPMLYVSGYQWGGEQEVTCFAQDTTVVFSTSMATDFSNYEYHVHDFSNPNSDRFEPIDNQSNISVEPDKNTVRIHLNNLQQHTEYRIHFIEDSTNNEYFIRVVYGKEGEIIFYSEAENSSIGIPGHCPLTPFLRRNELMRYLSSDGSSFYLSNDNSHMISQGHSDRPLSVDGYYIGMSEAGMIKPLLQKNDALGNIEEYGVIIENGKVFLLWFFNFDGYYLACKEDGTVFFSPEKNVEAAWII